jgi:phosphoglycolate phosphatase
MEELLQGCRAAGVLTAVASQKPEAFIHKILAGIGFAHYFDAIAGTDLQRVNPDKTDILTDALRKLGGVAPKNALMLGDRRFDMEAAKKLGMTACGCLFGFGTRAELVESGADFLAQDAYEIARYIHS